jgi:cytochrome c-type biogenesis protein CcmH/NrfG
MAADARLAGAYQELQLALADKDGPHAQECFRRSAATFRSNARALVDLGDAYVAAGSPTQAIQAWTLAARLAPFNPVPVARLAVLARSQGQGDASAKLAELAVKRAPK